MNANAAYFNLDAPLKFLRFYNVLVFIVESITVVEYFNIQECYNASAALILSEESYVSNLVTRSIASGEIVAHSSSSVWNTPFLTFLIIYSSVAPLNGG